MGDLYPGILRCILSGRAFRAGGASLTIFADQQTNRHIGSWEMPASWFQSINPLGIILLAPFVQQPVVSLGRRGAEPPSLPRWRLAWPLFAWLYRDRRWRKGVDASIKISMWWLIVLYVLHTMGELCLSPIGLSMVSKLAPIRFWLTADGRLVPRQCRRQQTGRITHSALILREPENMPLLLGPVEIPPFWDSKSRIRSFFRSLHRQRAGPLPCCCSYCIVG